MVRCFQVLLNHLCQLTELFCVGKKVTYATTLSLYFNTYFQCSVKYDGVQFLVV
jgi:hypothetical protein